MIVYAESSAILRWILGEPSGAEIVDLLKPAQTVFSSRLTLAECHRVIQRGVAGSNFNESDALEFGALLAQAAARWDLLEVTADVLSRVQLRFPVEPLRTLDAIHLASALKAKALRPDLHMLSVDERLRQNAAALGLEVLPVH
jgi:predicted nucleic acid-binding protein